MDRKEKYALLRSQTVKGKKIFSAKEATILKDRTLEKVKHLIKEKTRLTKEWNAIMAYYTNKRDSNE